MGKEWLYWVGGRGGGGGGGGGESGRSSTKKGRRMPEEMKEAATSAGCMCAVFHLFDLHHLQFPLNQQNPSDVHPNNASLQEEATTSEGVEAPRNSLELEEPATMNAASMSLAMKEDENLNFPVGIQIKTSHGKLSSPRISTSASKSRLDDFSSECSSNSPGTKTPSLVARLMGLDLLPECSSPAISSSSPKSRPKPRLHQNHHQRKDRNILHSRSSRSFFDDYIGIGARSLPETPRISSARRSDVEYHRLSLQINKENVNEEFALSDKMVARRGRFRLQPQDENRSPGHYAKQIVKHVKESVSRRVGLDITNANRNADYPRRDENLILLKPTKKNSKILSRFEGEISPDGKQSNTPSRSPRLRFLDPSKNKPTTNSVTKSPRVSSSSDNHQSRGITNPSKPKPEAIIPLQELQHTKKVSSTGKCSSSRLKKLPPQASDHAIRNKREEPFVRSTATNKLNLTDKKSKRTPLSSDILKKGPSPPPAKLPQKQSQVSDALSSKSSTQLSSNPSQSYTQLQLQPDKIFTFPETALPASTNGCATALPGGASSEYGNYIHRILKRVGIINKANPLALAKWHNSSHTIDPSIFHHLELFLPSTTNSTAADGCNTILNHRCNRKLIFQLVDELLAEILTPQFNLKQWISSTSENGHFPLVDELCQKIDSFPAANCLVLEDIDSLIDKDLLKSQLNGFFDEEENIVCEIEGEIVEWLVRETLAVIGGHAAEEPTETGRCHVGLSRAEMPLVL